MTAVRAAAVAEVDKHFAVTVPGGGAMTAIYAVKAALARSTGGDHPLLRLEAEHRGMTVADVAASVLDRAAAADAALVEHEIARQTAKAAVVAAADEHAVRRVLLMLQTEPAR